MRLFVKILFKLNLCLMRKVIFRTLLLMVAMSFGLFSNAQITSFPYLEDFEGGANGWTSGGTASTWNLGTATASSLPNNAVLNGVNIWITGIDMDYNNDEDSWVVSPYFDFTGLTVPVVEFSINYQTESCCDGANLEYSIDSGATWVNIGVQGDPYNWYNNSVDQWRGNAPDWLQARHEMAVLGGEPDVLLRVHFTSDGSVTNPGMAFDNFQVYDMPMNDLTPIALDGPAEGCGLSNTETIIAEIFNQAAEAQDTFDISYSIDGGATWVTETYNDTLLPGDTLVYTFVIPADFSSIGNYDVMIVVNNQGDEFPNNDTATFQVTNKPVISSYPYIQDFEGAQYWTTGGILSSWELGAPNNIIINSAASGTNAWVTNLTGNYPNDEYSYVESPCFDFSTLNNPLVQMNVWWNAESNYDGAALYYSIDDGANWVNIGVLGDWFNWYNDATISGLPADGWTGSNGSGGWVEVKHLLTVLAGQPSVKFRMYFGSDGSVQDEGFGFDDFTIREGEINFAITEINYNGPEIGTDTTEFIEWYNYGQDAVNVNGYYYSQGVTDTLPDVTVLPGEFFVSAYDSTVMANFFNYTGAITWDAGGLANGGEDIALHTSWGTLVDSLGYDDANGWPTQPDGNGPSLVFCEQNIGMDANDPVNWNISNSYVDTLNGMDVYASPGVLDSTCYSWDLAIVDLQTGDTIADCDFSATDTVMIELTNLGNQIISAGDTIFGWYQLDTNTVVPDTMVLNADFNPGDTVLFMFAQTVDLSALGYYSAGLWFNYFDDAENINDSVFITVYHYQPVVDLGPDTIWTSQPDTILLDAGAGFDSYIWQDSSTAQTFNVVTAGTYYVTALDSNDCSASDTIVVELVLIPTDLAITDPPSGDWYDCHLTANDTAEILFTNLENTAVSSGDTIYFWYQIDGNPVVADTLVLTSDLNQYDTIPFVFDQTIDFSALTTYNFSIWLNYQGDTIQSNDTVSGTVTHYELSIDLGPDTICTNQPDTVVLDPGAGFDAYLWQDSSTAQTFNVTTYGTYFVQVYDTNWCDATDTIVVDNCVGIEETELTGVSIYPNPNNGQFVIDLPNAENVQIEVLTISGQVVYLKQSVNAHNVIDLSGFDKGIYFVKLSNNKEVANYKVVIQ